MSTNQGARGLNLEINLGEVFAHVNTGENRLGGAGFYIYKLSIATFSDPFIQIKKSYQIF